MHLDRSVLVAALLALTACTDPVLPAADAGPIADAASTGDAAHGRDTGADAARAGDAGSDAGHDGSGPDACVDGDGDGDPALACGGGDCDDANAARSSLAEEVCGAAAVDEDCDGHVDEGVTVPLHADSDHDGYGAAASTSTGCPGAGLLADGTDCDDTRPDVSPGASELCANAIDDDCDRTVDEVGPTTFYPDADHDGFGVAGATMVAATCTPPVGYAANAADCDDTRASTHPGNPSDPCNGLDDACMLGLAGAGLDGSEDADGDHHGNPSACSGTGGWPADDCDDTSATIHPGASERCNRLDDDCSSGGGAAPAEDMDADGFAPRFTSICSGGFPTSDCNDAVATTHPGAIEICNYVDDDCSQTFGTTEPIEDQDRDMHAPPTAPCTGGYPKDDCNDGSATMHPGAAELCNALDDDCSTPAAPGNVDRTEDQDADFHSPPTATCTGGFPLDDCDDLRASFHPGAPMSAPRVIAPALGAHTASARPTFRWASGGDACLASPTWEIAADDSCASATSCDFFMPSPEIHTTGVTTTTWAATASLHAGRSYYHVRECSSATGCGPWSVIRAIDVGRAVGDLNGDGHADLVIGAPDHIDGAGWHGGRAYVYYGTAAGLPSTPSLTIDPPWSSVVAEQRFGSSIAIGDFTGDGYADLAVAAVGSVYWYMGGASGISPSSVSDISIFGSSSETLATLGDVQADGYDDLAVSVHDGGPERVEVFYGGRSGGLSTTSNVEIRSPTPGEPSSGFGASLASAGDVDGDGYADLVVGAPGSDATAVDGGRVYVFHGSPFDLATSPTFTIDAPSPQAGAAFGASVAAADLDGDGFSDVIASAPLHDGVRVDEGAVSVHAGTNLPGRLIAVATLDAPGDEMGARFGSSMAVGDVSGDGLVDLVVGMPGADGAGADVGRVLVYADGATGLVTAPLATLSDASGTAGAALGASVAVIGDVDGDGAWEVAAGAPLDDGAAMDAGTTLVWRGAALSAGPMITLDDPTGRTGPHFGTALARTDTQRRDARETRRARSVGLVTERRTFVARA